MKFLILLLTLLLSSSCTKNKDQKISSETKINPYIIAAAQLDKDLLADATSLSLTINVRGSILARKNLQIFQML